MRRRPARAHRSARGSAPRNGAAARSREDARPASDAPPGDGPGVENGGPQGQGATPRPAREILEALAPSVAVTPAAPPPVENRAEPVPDGWPAGGAVSTASDECRHFQADDGEWVARRVGESGYGTGCMGKAALDALRFARMDSPTGGVREILAPRHDLSLYFDDELRGLLARALPVLDDGHEPGSERPV